MSNELNKHILEAAKSGDLKKITTLLDHAKAFDMEGINLNEPLSWAAHNGHTSIVQLLLDHHADVNHRDEQGNTALHWAAYNAHTDTVILLMSRGADKRLLNKNALTAATFSQVHAHMNPEIPCVSQLIEEMANEIIRLRARVAELESALAMRTSHYENYQSPVSDTHAITLNRFSIYK